MFTNKPKILMFGWEFPPQKSGGLGTACFALTKALSEAGIGVTFVLPRRMDADSRYANILFADDERVDIKKFGVLFSSYNSAEQYHTTRMILDEGGMYGATLFEEVERYAYRAGFIAMSNDFDIIHAHDWLSFQAGVAAKKVSGKPLVLHVHATEFDRTGGQGVNQRVYNIERNAMADADAIIAVSHFTKSKIIEQYGVAPDKIQVAHNGVDVGACNYGISTDFDVLKKQGIKIVLSLGRITIQKGVDYFIRAAKQVLDYKKNVLFVIVGSGDMHNEMMRRVAHMGISDKVLFTGWASTKESMRMFAAADLYIMPSVSEPFGLVALEALANNTPVIISKQSGVSEVLSHALKVDFWDTDEMTNKIIMALDYPSLANTLTRNGKEQASHIGWDRAVVTCLSVYEDVCNKMKSQSPAMYY